jgi:2-polyprenyl-3-methyl-5-hydroxy-6-metoxy-1,4-benzoquinol methylase
MSHSTDTVRPGYDRWAAVYDHDANPLPALEEPVMQKTLGSVNGLRVLDVGCGTGRHSLWLSAAGALVTAIDFSEGMLQSARRKPGLEQVQFHVHDLHEPLPFADGSFDVLISGLVLEHLRALKPFFTELHRVVVPNGKVALSTLHPSMFLRGSQARFTDPETGAIVQPGSINHSYGDMVLGALAAGFEIADLIELAPDEEFVKRYPRAEKYLGWPMLLAMILSR